MASALDVYKYNEKLPKKLLTGMSKKEKANANALLYSTQLTNAKSFQFNADQADITRDFNKQEAQTARDWQERMSNTAHAREVKDLKAAGLNPVLSANNGAQSYTTSAASAANASAKADSASSAIAAYGGSVLNSAATRYAANQSAASSRYMADRQLEMANISAYAQMYSADKHLEATKYSTDYSKSANIAGILDSVIKALASGDEQSPYLVGIKNLIGIVKDVFSSGSSDGWTVWDLFKPGTKSMTAGNLSDVGRAKINTALYRGAYEINRATQNALILCMTGNQQQREQAAYILSKNKKKKKNKNG